MLRRDGAEPPLGPGGASAQPACNCLAAAPRPAPCRPLAPSPPPICAPQWRAWSRPTRCCRCSRRGRCSSECGAHLALRPASQLPHPPAPFHRLPTRSSSISLSPCPCRYTAELKLPRSQPLADKRRLVGRLIAKWAALAWGRAGQVGGAGWPSSAAGTSAEQPLIKQAPRCSNPLHPGACRLRPQAGPGGVPAHAVRQRAGPRHQRGRGQARERGAGPGHAPRGATLRRGHQRAGQLQPARGGAGCELWRALWCCSSGGSGASSTAAPGAGLDHPPPTLLPHQRCATWPRAASAWPPPYIRPRQSALPCSTAAWSCSGGGWSTLGP